MAYTVFSPPINFILHYFRFTTSVVFTVTLCSQTVLANDAITFTDIANIESSGISYRNIGFSNTPYLTSYTIFPLEVVLSNPNYLSGAPGVAIFDYDGDEDLDIFVTNSPGTPNSLYANQLREKGELSFIDRAQTAGVAGIDKINLGVCYGDIDNDDDKDLLVLGGRTSPSQLYENQGNGTFQNISHNAVADALVGRTAFACSMADFNGDGRLDFVIANGRVNPGTDPIFSQNQVLINIGNNRFTDVSSDSGIQNFAGNSFAIAAVDYDLDGDADFIVVSDDPLGFTRVYQNDGTGHFTDVTSKVGTDRPGGWMGLAFADFNSDGNMDFFNTNLGGYIMAYQRDNLGLALDYPPSFWNSGWFLGKDDGTFMFPNVGDIGITPFGWGVSAIDYDNDADTDVIFHGGIVNGLPVKDASNPGALLKNDGHANFTRDMIALSNSTNHSRRNVRGMATGDLNDDGFFDIVSASNADWSENLPLQPYLSHSLGGQFDDSAYSWPIFSPLDPNDFSQGFLWNGYEPDNGTLSVEINSADNKNHWVKVVTRGSLGLTTNGRVNRDGIGAVVFFQPDDKQTVMKPVVGGSSHMSANSLQVGFGLGEKEKGTVEILWPGGVRNRLYKVHSAERILFPEIPCSFDTTALTKQEYKTCVKLALKELVASEVISSEDRARFYRSAVKAFKESHKRDGEREDVENDKQ